MNSKKVKHIRRTLTRMGADWREAKYIYSSHPKEKAHQKEYPKKVIQFTRAGAKNLTKWVPFKVGTLNLSGCGKKIYRHYKQVASRV